MKKDKMIAILMILAICIIFVVSQVKTMEMERFARRGVEEIVHKKIQNDCDNTRICDDSILNIHNDFDFSIVAGPFEVARYDYHYSTAPDSYKLFITKMDYGPTPNGEYGYILISENDKKRNKHYRYSVSEYSLSAGESYNRPKVLIGVEDLELDGHIGPSYVFKVGVNREIVKNEVYELFDGENVRYARDNVASFVNEKLKSFSNDTYVYTNNELLLRRIE